jgi:ATP-binding cassette subfamily F protein 3
LGLVGPNGAGKTTLFSIILGEQSADDGKVVWERGANFGFLPQESAPVGEETVLNLACAVDAEFGMAHRLMGTAEEGSEEHLKAVSVFSEREGWHIEARAKQVLKGLAFRESDFQRPARTLSGGWVMRAHLARLLVMEPDLLLLDEPTNHLDLESLGWFQNHLREYRGGIVVISHDRAFLNAIVGGIVELRRARLHRYRGNYDEYLVQKAERAEQQLAAHRNQQKEIASLQAFADRFRAKASKASQAQSKLKQIERMERIEAPEADEKTVSNFRFPQPARSGLKAVNLSGVHHAYGELVVYDCLDFEAQRGQRTVLVGPNGAGKSTLLKLLAGVIPVVRGTRELGYQVAVGYFAQHRMEMLGNAGTVLEVASQTAPHGVSEQTVRTLLGAFLFRGDDVDKPVAVLSGGEKTRLALVRLLLNPPNLLLMDEPTTHLDMGSIDALIGALKQFEGTLIFISHDVHFIRSLATSVLHISAGRLTPYAGDYDYYLAKTQSTDARAALTAGEGLTDHRAGAVRDVVASSGGIGMKEQREQRRQDAADRAARTKLRREAEKKVTLAEGVVAELEKRQAELVSALEDPESYKDAGVALRLNRELTGVQEDLEAANAAWMEAASALEVFSE